MFCEDHYDATSTTYQNVRVTPDPNLHPANYYWGRVKKEREAERSETASQMNHLLERSATTRDTSCIEEMRTEDLALKWQAIR